ncbi:MAG: 50S ribosomal protein L15 [Nitrospirae bacterium]|nr:50S ribosomal protein L15 [Nitrospirota bacterium]
MRLDKLRPHPGATHRTTRVGRGPGSGMGKTSTKGHKGQLARSGGGKGPGFEGGQQPLIRRAPKRGFRAPVRVRWTVVSLERLGRLTGGGEIDLERLRREGVLNSRRAKVKILGDGEVTAALTVSAHAFSASAKAKIEAAGGTVRVVTDD